MGAAGSIGQPVDHKLGLGITADSSYETNAVHRTQHAGSEVTIYTTELG